MPPNSTDGGRQLTWLTGAQGDALYHRLASEGPLPASDVAGPVLDRLVELGVAAVSGGMADALPPRAVIEGRADELSRLATRTRDAADLLHEIWQAERRSSGRVEFLSGESADLAMLGMLDNAEGEVVGLSIGPGGDRAIQPAPGVLAALARGVEVRGVYGTEILGHPLGLEAARQCIAAGEQARVFPNVPINLVVNNGHALLVLPYGEGESVQVLSCRHSRLVQALQGVFEAYWQLAMPLPEGDLGTDVPDGTRQLLTLLSVGLTDHAIAREMGVSERTVGRRITRLQRTLGAQTRFQLGVQAARQGWF